MTDHGDDEDDDLAGGLSPTMATIATAAGQDAALLIAKSYGGTRVIVPVAAGNNWLTKLVGRDKAVKIIEALGSARRLDVPLGPDGGYTGTSRRQLFRRLEEMDASGATATEMARTLGIPDRRVRRWRATRRAQFAGLQRDLFE